MPHPDQAPPAFRLRDGFKLLGIALLVALVLRLFVIEGFRIPSESMEKTLLVGDFVLVSKLHYGPRLPMSLGLPMTPWYAEGVHLPYLRLPGFGKVRRGHLIVFNFPPDDGPVDRRMHYIKRVAGMPGDTVALDNKQLIVNDRRVPLRETMQQRWVARADSGVWLSFNALRSLGATQVAAPGHRLDRVTFEATSTVAEQIAALPGIRSVVPFVQRAGERLRVFPANSGYGRDTYGPLYVPAKGDTIPLTAQTWSVFKTLLVHHEGQNARLRTDGTVEIDGTPVTSYVVRENYYFVLGDNRDSSVDSRIWGFVPESHVVGKAVLVYFSWNEEAQRIRLSRLFSSIP